jgi:hypothetical protein
LCAPVELWRGRGRGRRLLLLLLGCMPVLRGELSVSWVAVRGSHPSTLAALPCARARCIVIRLTIIVMRLTIVLPPGAADARDRPQAAGVSDGVAQAGAAHALGLHPAVGYPELRGSLPPQKRPKAAGMLRLDRCMPAHPAPPQRLFTPRLSHTDYVHPVNLSLPSPPCDPLACVPACRPLCSVGRARSCPELAPSAPVPLTTHGGGSWGRRRRSATRLTSSAEASGRTPTRPPRPSASSSSCCTTTPCAPPPPAAARRPRPRPADRARQSGWR